MAVFGRIADGSGSAGIAVGTSAAHFICGTAFQAPGDGVATKMTAILSLGLGGRENPTYKTKCSLYDLDTVSDTHDLVANGVTDELTWTAFGFPGSGTFDYPFSGTQPIIVNGNWYLMTLWGEITSSSSSISFIKLNYQNTGTPYFVYQDNTPYGTYPDPLSAGDIANFEACLSCTYTPTAATGTPQRMRMGFGI